MNCPLCKSADESGLVMRSDMGMAVAKNNTFIADCKSAIEHGLRDVGEVSV